jgi:transcriptional regulator with XRE-family HTH domain
MEGQTMSKQTVGQFTTFVGKRIATRRKAKKITAEDMAKKIGVSAVVLDHMEHGLCHINLEQLIQFVRYLSTTSDLLGLPHYDDEEMTKFLGKTIDAMSEEDLRNWKANPHSFAGDRHRLFILDIDEEEG